jgi:hypothetical protein
MTERTEVTVTQPENIVGRWIMYSPDDLTSSGRAIGFVEGMHETGIFRPRTKARRVVEFSVLIRGTDGEATTKTFRRAEQKTATFATDEEIEQWIGAVATRTAPVRAPATDVSFRSLGLIAATGFVLGVALTPVADGSAMVVVGLTLISFAVSIAVDQLRAAHTFQAATRTHMSMVADLRSAAHRP